MRGRDEDESDGHPYRQPREPTAPPRRLEHARSGLSRIALAALALLGAWAGSIAWHEHALNEAVNALPLAVQEQAYRRAYDELASVCTTQRHLDAHCREEAQFILRFPQCDDHCRDLARPFFRVAAK